MGKFDGDLKCPECGEITTVADMVITGGFCNNENGNCDTTGDTLREHYISEECWVARFEEWKNEQEKHNELVR